MNPIVFALRRPYTVMVAVVAAMLASALATSKARVDIFPPLNQPVIYVCQPYGGMNPGQMEGLLTSYYEYHFLYVNGIEHVESKNIQGMSLLKLQFHPGTDMAQAMAETVAAVNRSRFMMPPGTVPPFVMRLDTGSASIGYLVLNSDTLAIKDIQDIATTKVRPMFTSVPGISTPPAFGGNQRAIVVSINPEKLKSHNLSIDQISESLANGNVVVPSGNIRIGDLNYLVNSNAMVGSKPVEELGQIPVKFGENPVLLRDVVTSIADASDITAGYVLVNGRRSVYMLVTKRAEASTISVVNELQKALPRMREAAPGVDIQFAFDQSPIVKEAMSGVIVEGLIGAGLTGLMVLLFLRDWRSVIVVVLNIPIALMMSVLALWICGQTINLMTLGGLALAVGILVDEATVEVENIHTQMHHTTSIAKAVRAGNAETAVPRLLAMLCILAVFVPSFFMEGATRELFVPLSMSVGFAMISSYLLSSTFVPVMSVWLLNHRAVPEDSHFFGRVQRFYMRLLESLDNSRGLVVLSYFSLAALALVGLASGLGTSIFPQTDKGQFTLRLRAPTGTRIERTEALSQQALKIIEREAKTVKMSVGYVGTFPTNYPVQGCYQWTSGPEEAILKVAIPPSAGIRIDAFQERLREVLPTELKAWLREQWKTDGVPEPEWAARENELRLSFEPGDLINEVMSFGSPTQVEVQISGNNLPATLAATKRLHEKLKQVPELRDLQMQQQQNYPTIDVNIDRARGGSMDLNVRSITNSLIPSTSSSRYVAPNYWNDPKSGQAYIVQVQIPPPQMNSIDELGQVPIRGMAGGILGMGVSSPVMTTSDSMPLTGFSGGTGKLLRDVATLKATTTPAEIDRYNMRRYLSLAANVKDKDLGKVGRGVQAAIAEAKREIIEQNYDDQKKKLPPGPEAEAKWNASRDADLAAGKLPDGVFIDLRGQLTTLAQVQSNLTVGLAVAVVAILLLLVGYFQSFKLAFIALASVPATLCGVGIILTLTGTTLNLQSFMGTIMAIGVSVANAILVVSFAETDRLKHGDSRRAAITGGTSRLRPILMTSCAMVAGMLPMALGLGEGGDQTAPLGRAVIGGLVASTFATLFVLPTLFTLLQRNASRKTASLNPDDAPDADEASGRMTYP